MREHLKILEAKANKFKEIIKIMEFEPGRIKTTVTEYGINDVVAYAKMLRTIVAIREYIDKL